MVSINHEKKIIFFHIPKTAGSYIQEILLRYYNFFPYNGCTFEAKTTMCTIKEMSSAKYIRDLEVQRVLGIINLNEFIFFSFVRNPYTRFISGWKFIVEKGHIPSEMTLIKIIKNKEGLSGIPYNHMFMTQMQYLNGYPLDNVGKYEEIEDDLSLILKEYGFTINHIPSKKNVTSEYGDYKKFYTQEILNFVNVYFHEDFINFGYDKISSISEFQNN